MSVIRALLTGSIDYAGLFPPAGLDMHTAVRNYAGYFAGEESWALGQFIVPVGRLAEFTQVFNEVCCDEGADAWLLSVLSSNDAGEDVRRIAAFAQGAVFIDTIELKAAGPEDTELLLAGLPQGLTAYVEIAPEKTNEMLPVLARSGARAKIRTGGLTPDAFPASIEVARFLMACADAEIPFKATAGLHHPLRGAYPLTDEEGSAVDKMHGFVNIFLAAALACLGKDEDLLVDTLEEESSSAFHFEEDMVRWHSNELTLGQIGALRRDFAIDFGSCSFTGPIAALKELGWL